MQIDAIHTIHIIHIITIYYTTLHVYVLYRRSKILHPAEPLFVCPGRLHVLRDNLET